MKLQAAYLAKRRHQRSVSADPSMLLPTTVRSISNKRSVEDRALIVSDTMRHIAADHTMLDAACSQGTGTTNAVAARSIIGRPSPSEINAVDDITIL